jgi:hypothetical protein
MDLYNLRRTLSKEEDIIYEVIILGGGIAGLSAATEASNRGKKVLLLEAKPKLGGRIGTWHGKPTGATWCHGTELEEGGVNPIYQKLIEAEKEKKEAAEHVASKRYLGKITCFDKNKKEYPFISIYTVCELIGENGVGQTLKEKFVDFTQKTKENHPVIVGLQKKLNLNFHDPALLDLIAHQLSMLSGGGSLESLSGEAFSGQDEIEYSGDEFRFLPLGWQPLVDSYEKQLESSSNVKVKINSPIVDVRQLKNNTIQVQDKNGVSYVGKVVVNSLPLGVLQSKAINFSPPLPEEPLKKHNAGDLVRIIIEYPPNAILGKNPLYFIDTDEATIRVNNIEKLTGKNQNSLVITYSPHAPRKDDSRAVLQKTLSALVMHQIVINDANPLAVHIEDWGKDSFSLGSFSSPRVPDASVRDLKTSLDSVFENMYFVGEAVSDTPGTVHGAALSGQKAIVALFDNNQPKIDLSKPKV